MTDVASIDCGIRFFLTTTSQFVFGLETLYVVNICLWVTGKVVSRSVDISETLADDSRFYL